MIAWQTELLKQTHGSLCKYLVIKPPQITAGVEI